MGTAARLGTGLQWFPSTLPCLSQSWKKGSTLQNALHHQAAPLDLVFSFINEKH